MKPQASFVQLDRLGRARQQLRVITTSSESASGVFDRSIRCAIGVQASLSVRAADLGTLRAQAAALYANTLSPSVLKQSDDQAIAALMALHRAIGQRSAEELEHWGVVAAPRTLGRRRISESLVKFQQQGAWNTSPHLIPFLSLHSLPGLLSQAIPSHGPNLGAGGLKGSEGEALTAAVAMLHGERLPGVFVVFTGWERDSLVIENDNRCQAAVIGLQRPDAGIALGDLEIAPGGGDESAPSFTLESLMETLEYQSGARWRLNGAACSLSLEQCWMEAAA